MNLEMGSLQACGTSLVSFGVQSPRSRNRFKVNISKHPAPWTPADNREVDFVKLEVSRVETRRRNEQR